MQTSAWNSCNVLFAVNRFFVCARFMFFLCAEQIQGTAAVVRTVDGAGAVGPSTTKAEKMRVRFD